MTSPHAPRIASGFAVLCLALGAMPARAATRSPAEASYVGLWACDSTFGPAVKGELALARTAAGWQASIGGRRAAAEVIGDSLSFRLAGDEGAFRGAMLSGGRAIEGFWIQPPGVVLGQAIATPVRLFAAGANEWRGAIEPLADSFTLFLSIARDSAGGVRAAFRNPDVNSRGGASRFEVALDGDSLRFVAKPGGDRPEVRLAAAWDAAGRRIRVRWPDLDQVLTLAPASPALAARAWPRPPGGRYRYRAPQRTDDGWSVGRAAAAGMDEAALARLVERLAGVDPFEPSAPLVHSLLIARHGRLVLEEYFQGAGRDALHDLRSASKTFASVMLGAEMARGTAIAPETRVYPLLARLGPTRNPDPRKAAITLGQLMTHSSGLACDDNDDASPGNEGSMQAQRAQPDWWRYTLDLPLAFDPGSHYAYCSAGMNLVGAALTVATGTWLPALFARDVARPLGIGRYAVNLMPTGEGYAGGGMWLRARDLLKLGAAYLDGGRWNGRRLVDSTWAERSTALQMASASGGDGFAWHLNTLESGGRSYREFEANGNGGQLLIVLPELDLAIAITAGNYGMYGVWRKFRTEMVPNEIIPAIRER